MNQKNETFLCYWLPVFVYCLIIFLQSAFPSPIQKPGIPHLDKVSHFAGYALLGALFFRAFRASRPSARTCVLMILSVLSATLYGAGDELHQQFVPGRTADPLDLIADFLGSGAGVWLYPRVSGRMNGYIRKIVD